MNCGWRHQGEGYVASSVQREIGMATLPLTHRAQASVATNHGTHLASWVLISRAWYPDATAAHLAQSIFLLMMALTQAVKESIWLQVLLSALGAARHREELQNINIDNQGALALARNPEFHARIKHIDIQYHFVQEHTETGKIRSTYCPTTDMTADIFTKALPQPAFTRHNLGLCLIDRSVLMLQHTEMEGEENYHQRRDGIGAPVRGGVENHWSSPDMTLTLTLAQLRTYQKTTGGLLAKVHI